MCVCVISSLRVKPEINKDVTVGGNKSHKVTTNNTSFSIFIKCTNVYHFRETVFRTNILKSRLK